MKNDLGLRGLEYVVTEIAGVRIEITCTVYRNDLYRLTIGQDIGFGATLKGRFFFLAAFAGRLLPGLVGGHLFVEIAFSATAAGGPEAIDAKIFFDVIAVDLEFEDDEPLTEGLQTYQQDE